MLKILRLTALFAALTVLAAYTGGCYRTGTQSADEKRPMIVFVYKTVGDTIEFWKSITDGIEAASKDFNIDYTIIGAEEESDIEGNAQAVLEAITMAPDAIVMTAADYQLLEPYAKAVADSGILLLTMDCDVAGGYSRCFVATDNVMLGRLMGEEMAKRVPPDGKVGIIGHVKGTDSGIGRVTGAVETLSKPLDRVIEPVYCDNHAEESMRLTKKIIEENPDLTGLIGTNELSALGVAMAVEELGLKDKITVVTCDNSSKQITYLEQGVIDVTLSQRPFNMGYFSARAAVELLEGKNNSEIPDFIDTGCEVITRENMFSMENQKLLFPFRG